MNGAYELYKGDCLELMKEIPDNSIDMILTDPPYGIMLGIEKSTAAKDIGYKACDWDTKINTDKLFQECNRVLRPNGKCILFAQEPYTSELITGTLASLPFLYRAIWKKNHFANALGVKKAMVSYVEDVCIFAKIYRKSHYQATHPLRSYFMDEKKKSKLTTKQFKILLGNNMASHYFTKGEQFLFPTEEMYKKLQSTGYFKEDYQKLREINDQYVKTIYNDMNKECPAVFNLWEGGKFKSNVLEYRKDNEYFHPTQKPVALLEDLIKTFSNDGDIILDFTMGSGSTGVACMNTNRRFIGIELDDAYFLCAEKRIMEAAGLQSLSRGKP